MTQPEVLLDGLTFGECPRWHQGKLWFSDMHGGAVMTVLPDGTNEVVVEVPGQPGGLGWLPDGTLLVVSMMDRKVLGLRDGRLDVHADLAELVSFPCNDMVVDRDGNAYVGNWGFDLYQPAALPERTRLVLVRPDGDASPVGDGLMYPNGSVIAPDGATLVVAESFGARLTEFPIETDGTLGAGRLFADLAPNIPDGVCLDAEGAVWAADPMHGECVRVRQGGEVADRIATGRGCFACALGGDDGRTLFLLTADDSDPVNTRALRTSRIEWMRVEVPGAGYP